MKAAGPFFLLAGLASAHSTISKIIIDGTSYPPYHPIIDAYLGNVRRIEWAPGGMSLVQDVKSPYMSCQSNPPALKAVARAGANVTLQWTRIIRMHKGPTITYLGSLPSPDTKPQEVDFFKIQEAGFDPIKNEWANQKASDNNNSLTLQLPSDIKAGTYILKTELWALHANDPAISAISFGAPPAPQIYNHCFNVEIVGDGTKTPVGVKFPGGYTVSDPGVRFTPYYGAGDGIEFNKKYIIPGPPLYKGQYNAPKGSRPVVKDTGAYKPDIQSKYEQLTAKMEGITGPLVGIADIGWPKNSMDPKYFFSHVDQANANLKAAWNNMGVFQDLKNFKAFLSAQKVAR